jgi:hypothetical protein
VALGAGDFVTYLERPEWGLGEVRRVEPNGLLVANFPEARPSYQGEFGSGELEVANVPKPKVARTA